MTTPRINLLPHREMKKAQQRRLFVFICVMTVVLAAGVIGLLGAFVQNQIDRQQQRNEFIKAENAKLDDQIKEVANLKQEIEGLKSRQLAVEGLQANRNEPVQILEDLVKQTPEGVFLTSLKQNGRKLALNGIAQSNERVSEFLRNLSNTSVYLTQPELIEIKANSIGQGRAQRAVFDFSMNVSLKDLKKAPDVKPASGVAPASAAVISSSASSSAPGASAVQLTPASGAIASGASVAAASQSQPVTTPKAASGPVTRPPSETALAIPPTASMVPRAATPSLASAVRPTANTATQR